MLLGCQMLEKLFYETYITDGQTYEKQMNRNKLKSNVVSSRIQFVFQQINT